MAKYLVVMFKYLVGVAAKERNMSAVTFKDLGRNNARNSQERNQAYLVWSQSTATFYYAANENRKTIITMHWMNADKIVHNC